MGSMNNRLVKIEKKKKKKDGFKPNLVERALNFL